MTVNDFTERWLRGPSVTAFRIRPTDNGGAEITVWLRAFAHREFLQGDFVVESASLGPSCEVAAYPVVALRTIRMRGLAVLCGITTSWWPRFWIMTEKAARTQVQWFGEEAKKIDDEI